MVFINQSVQVVERIKKEMRTHLAFQVHQFKIYFFLSLFKYRSDLIKDPTGAPIKQQRPIKESHDGKHRFNISIFNEDEDGSHADGE
jgi:hypothetical protein